MKILLLRGLAGGVVFGRCHKRGSVLILVVFLTFSLILGRAVNELLVVTWVILRLESVEGGIIVTLLLLLLLPVYFLVPLFLPIHFN